MDDAEYHKRITAYIKNPNDDPEISQRIEEFKAISSYVSGAYDDDESFKNLDKFLNSIESQYRLKGCNCIFYLTLPPSVFNPSPEGSSGMHIFLMALITLWWRSLQERPSVCMRAHECPQG